MIEKEYGSLKPETLARAENLLESCWDFLGDFRDLKEDVKSHLPDECKDLVDKLEHKYEEPNIALWVSAEGIMKKLANM